MVDPAYRTNGNFAFCFAVHHPTRVTECVEMVRSLKYHEKKLLKKVDFVTWKSDNSLREVRVMRKYHLQKREDYTKLVFCKWPAFMRSLFMCTVLLGHVLGTTSWWGW